VVLLHPGFNRRVAKAVIVEEVDWLHWRLWNGKAKDAQIGIDRIRALMDHFRCENGQQKSIALMKILDRLARAGRLSYRPERLGGQLRRVAPCQIASWYCDHRRDSQFSGEPLDEQIATDAQVAARCRFSDPGSLRCLQRHVRFGIRTKISPSQ
jgi:hypothetical protein